MKEKVKFNKNDVKKLIIQIIMVAFAGIVGGASFKSFFDAMDTKIVPTGMSGLAMLIVVWLKGIGITLPTSVVYLILNAIIFAFAFKFFGWRFMLLSAIGLGTYVLGMQFGLIPEVVNSVTNPATQHTDLLILCVVGSILMGVCTGIGIRFGGTTGGSDVFGKLLNRIFPRIKTGVCILIFNGIVLTLSIITLGLSTGLYAVVNSIVSSLATDFVLDNSKKIVAYFIICNKADEISRGIMKQYGTGVTKLDGTGMFTGKQKDILLCLVPYDQSYKMREYVHKIDPDTFIFSTTVTETIGQLKFFKKKVNDFANLIQNPISDIKTLNNEELEKIILPDDDMSNENKQQTELNDNAKVEEIVKPKTSKAKREVTDINIKNEKNNKTAKVEKQKTIKSENPKRKQSSAKKSKQSK